MRYSVIYLKKKNAKTTTKIPPRINLFLVGQKQKLLGLSPGTEPGRPPPGEYLHCGSSTRLSELLPASLGQLSLISPNAIIPKPSNGTFH